MVDQTLKQAKTMGAPRAIALCRNFGGFLGFQAGRWKEAEEMLREAVDRYRALSASSGESSSLQRLGVLLTAQGRLDEAMVVLQDSVVIGERAVLRSHCLTRSYASMARNRLAAGDLHGAQSFMELGLETAHRHGNCVTCNALILPESVQVHLAQKRWDDALKDVEALEATAGRFESLAWTAMAKQARGRYLVCTGEVQGGAENLKEAEEAYTEYGNLYEAARCRLARAQQATSEQEKRELQLSAEHALREIGPGFVEGESLNLL
jgi:Tfp pilus assembly protein PilF